MTNEQRTILKEQSSISILMTNDQAQSRKLRDDFLLSLTIDH